MLRLFLRPKFQAVDGDDDGSTSNKGSSFVSLSQCWRKTGKTLFQTETKDLPRKPSCYKRDNGQRRTLSTRGRGMWRQIASETRWQAYISKARVAAFSVKRDDWKFEKGRAKMPTSPSRIPVPSGRRYVSPSAGSTTSSVSRIPRSTSPGKAATAEQIQSSSSARSISSNVLPASPTVTDDKQPTRPSEEEAPLAGQRSHPRYVSAHLGDPCTLGALDHLLDCGHKVLTHGPELCAGNCNQPHRDHANPRGLDDSFVCMACIVEEIKAERALKVQAFEQDLKRVDEIDGHTIFPEAIAQRIENVEVGWKALEFDEIEANARLGRVCYPFFVDPEYQESVDIIFTRRYSAKCKGKGQLISVDEGGQTK